MECRGIPGIGGILVFLGNRRGACSHCISRHWIIATVKAFTGVRWDIPISVIARKQIESTYICCRAFLGNARGVATDALQFPRSLTTTSVKISS